MLCSASLLSSWSSSTKSPDSALRFHQASLPQELIMVPMLDEPFSCDSTSRWQTHSTGSFTSHSHQIMVSTPICICSFVLVSSWYLTLGALWTCLASIIEAASLPPPLPFQGEFVFHSALCPQTGMSKLLLEVQPADFLFPLGELTSLHHQLYNMQTVVTVISLTSGLPLPNPCMHP